MSDVFDPEKVERFDGVSLCRYSDGEWQDGEPVVVLASDYDTLLKMYQDKCGESADLE